MAKLIGWLIIICLDIPNVIFRGFVLSVLWLWFVVPLGAGGIGIAHGIGLSMLVGLVAKNHHAAEKDDGGNAMGTAFGRQIGSLLVTLLAWGMGAIVHSFM